MIKPRVGLRTIGDEAHINIERERGSIRGGHDRAERRGAPLPQLFPAILPPLESHAHRALSRPLLKCVGISPTEQQRDTHFKVF